MRSLFEYILVFSKGDDYLFDIDKVRNFETLKQWWVKYPERYNPKGKTPEAIWNFDIPTQGSWGNGYIRHFCPLPEEMIEQILKITTTEESIVLDPFAGSGAVLSKADNMKRGYVGFELNSKYISMFEKYLKETGGEKRKEFELGNANQVKVDAFQKLIISLRALKYAKILHKKLVDANQKGPSKYFVAIEKDSPNIKNKLVAVSYNVLVQNTDTEEILKLIESILAKPPLSKYGIHPKVNVLSEVIEFEALIGDKEAFVYSSRVTHKYQKKYEKTDLLKTDNSCLIISEREVDLNEHDYA